MKTKNQKKSYGKKRQNILKMILKFYGKTDMYYQKKTNKTMLVKANGKGGFSKVGTGVSPVS